MKQSKPTSFLLSIPYLIWLIVFTVIPMGLIVFFAVTDKYGSFTLENLNKAGQYAPVLMQSIVLSIFATIICIVIAYPLSFIMSRQTANKKRTLMILVMLPMWMNFLLRTYAWMTILENNGLINRFLGLLGIGPLNLINTQGAVVLGMIYNYIPFMIIPIYTVMMKIKPATLEAAQDLGAGSWHIFSKVLLPLSMPGVRTGITLVFVPAVSTFIISQMLGGGSQLLIGDIIELQFLGNAYNPNLGAAISLVLMVLVLICMSILNTFDDEDMEGMI